MTEAWGQWPNAVPVLHAHRFTATFFIMTVTIDKAGGWLSASQIRALDRSGMTIGVHTWDHHAVTGHTAADWRTQLTGAKATLERIVGHPVPWFASVPRQDLGSGILGTVKTTV